MKTKVFLSAMMLALPLLLAGQEACTTIFSGSQALSYDNGSGKHVFISLTNFSSAVAGNRLKLSGSLTGDGAHKLYLGEYTVTTHLPGGDYRDVGALGGGDYEYFYLTQDMINTIKAGADLRIYGEGITITSVDLCAGKVGALHDPFHTIWTGYFWADDWTTLKFFKEAVSASVLTLSNYAAIRFYHEAGRTNFTMNLFVNDFEHRIATSENGGAIHITPTCADLILTDEIITALTGATGELYIQLDKGSGSAFNLTDIVLIPKNIDGCDNCFHVIY